MISNLIQKTSATLLTSLMAVFLMATAANADPVELSVSVTPENPAPGDVVTMTFSTEDAGSAYFFGVEVEFDSDVFELNDIQPGELMSPNPLSIADNLTESRIGASVVRTAGAATGAGNVVSLTFNVLPGAASGNTTFSIFDGDLRDSSGGTIDATVPESAEVFILEDDTVTFRVHYNNPEGWDEVYAYAFEPGVGEYISWPGEQMNDPEPDSEWFFYDIPIEFGNVVFSDGIVSQQTDDLQRNTDGWFDGTQWYDEEPNLDASRDVTFSVDMSVEEVDGEFDPATQVVYVRGSFNGWGDGVLMSDLSEDGLYDVTFPVQGQEGSEVFYKFYYAAEGDFEGGTWETDDVGMNGTNDRIFNLGPADQLQVLDTVFFNNESGDDDPVDPADERDVTFSVDMSVEDVDGEFDPATQVVYVRGSFNGWGDGVLMSDLTEDGLYDVTFAIEGDEGDQVFYKFYYAAEGDFEGGTWESDDVGMDGTNDRIFNLGPADQLQVLDTVFFNNDSGDPVDPEDEREVTFSVNMTVQQDLGFYDPGVGDIIYVRGDFNDFGTDNPLTAAGEGIYETTVTISGNEGSTQGYKFFIEAGDDRELPNTGWELLGDDPDLNRFFDLGPADEPQVLDTVFFNDNEGDDPVDPEDERDVTFSVDMNVQEDAGAFDPATQVVYVRGSFNGWGDGVLMSDASDDGIYEVTFSVEGAEGDLSFYKFYFAEEGDFEGGTWESDDVGQEDTENRAFVLGPADELQVLDTVFFNNIDGSPQPEREVTFSVDMSVQQDLGFYNPGLDDVVYLTGDFNGFSTDNPMTSSGDGIYETTVTILGDEGSTQAYKFRVIAGDDRELPNGGWELLEDDPDLNRFFDLGPADELQVLDTVFFNDDEGEPVDPDFVDVWPGDTNNDGVVNEVDVLALGTYWALTGPERPDASLEWEAQTAPAWNPVAATYADTDGSGLINQTDLLAIGVNFGETHSGGTSDRNDDPVFSVELPQIMEHEHIVVRVSPDQSVGIQGVSYSVAVEGPDYADFNVSSPVAGAWAEEWLDENRMIVFSRAADNGYSGAFVHKGMTEPKIAADFIEFEITPNTNWSGMAELIIERLVIVDGDGNQVRFTDLDVDVMLESGTSVNDDELPRETALHQNYPNPFNPTTNIVFELNENSAVTIEVVNILGQRVALLANNEDMNAGRHTRTFDASRLTSGVYLVRMTAGSQSFTRKMMLVK